MTDKEALVIAVKLINTQAKSINLLREQMALRTELEYRTSLGRKGLVKDD